MTMKISFDTPYWLINFYHSVTLISIFINSLGIYLIRFQSGKIDSFKYFLLWFTVCNLLSDFFMFFLTQPIPLLPIWAGYIHGPILTVVKIGTHLASVIGSVILGQQAAALTLCFVRKYQAISRIDSQNEVKDHWLLFVGLLGQVLIGIWVTLYFFSGIDRATSLLYIKQNYREYYEKFLELEDFQLYLSNEITIWFIASAGLMVVIFTAIIIFSTVKTLKLLKNLENQVSQIHLKKHKSAVSSLIAQLMTSPIAFLPPVASGFLLCSFDFEHIQVTSWILLAMTSCHGTINCLVMIMTCPPYRSFVKTMIMSRRCPGSVNTLIV